MAELTAAQVIANQQAARKARTTLSAMAKMAPKEITSKGK